MRLSTAIALGKATATLSRRLRTRDVIRLRSLPYLKRALATATVG